MVMLDALVDGTILDAYDPSIQNHNDGGSFDNNTITRTRYLLQQLVDKAATRRPDNAVHTNVLQPATNSKRSFQQVSSLLEAVGCQQCKLHGILTMLSSTTTTTSQNEIVAFINSLAKLLYPIQECHELIAQVQHRVVPNTPVKSNVSLDGVGLLDFIMGKIAIFAEEGYPAEDQETLLMEKALARNPELMVLGKHYGNSNPSKFLPFIKQFVLSSSGDDLVDVVVVSSGLAGLVTALQILDRGGRVTIVEKEHTIGGNFNKASSGINAVTQSINTEEEKSLFYNDTLRSAGASARPDLIQT